MNMPYKYRVSAVSYLNTIPFLYGLKKHKINKYIYLSLDNPSVCADKLLNDEVDIGLIPSAVLPLVKEGEIISDYCIGATNRVRSVILYSNEPIDQINTILLDYQSRTSVNLVKILADKFWKIKVNWKPAFPGYEETPLNRSEAAVVIGDRSFMMVNNYSYIFDLSAEWFSFTGLPFVFAIWTSNKQIEPEFLTMFNEALKYGVNNIPQAVKYEPESKVMDKFGLLNYLTQNVSYPLDDLKSEGLQRFLYELKNNKL